MIRLDSKEIRFRLSQDEAQALNEQGSIRENIYLPASHLSFRVECLSAPDEKSRVCQEGELITFWLAKNDREKLSLSPTPSDPISVVEFEIANTQIQFKLEVDVFNSKQRGHKK